MTNFSVSSTLEVEVSQSSLRSARDTIESELGDIQAGAGGGAVSSQLSRDTGAISDGGLIAGAAGGGVSVLLEQQNEILEDIRETLEKDAVSGGGSGLLRGLLTGGGLTLGASSLLSVTGSLALSASTVLAVSGTLALAATSVLAVTGTISLNPADVLTTAGTLAVGIASVLAITGALSLGAPAVLAVTGTLGLAASAVLAVTGATTLNAANVLTISGTLAVAAAAALAVTGVLSLPAAGTIAVVGTVAIAAGEVFDIVRDDVKRQERRKDSNRRVSVTRDGSGPFMTGNDISRTDEQTIDEAANLGVTGDGNAVGGTRNRAQERRRERGDVSGEVVTVEGGVDVIVNDRRKKDEIVRRVREQITDELRQQLGGR